MWGYVIFTVPFLSWTLYSHSMFWRNSVYSNCLLVWLIESRYHQLSFWISRFLTPFACFLNNWCFHTMLHLILFTITVTVMKMFSFRNFIVVDRVVFFFFLNLQGISIHSSPRGFYPLLHVISIALYFGEILFMAN